MNRKTTSPASNSPGYSLPGSRYVLVLGLSLAATSAALAAAEDTKATISAFIDQTCVDCHDPGERKGGLDLTKVPFDLASSASRAKWVQIHDRIEKGEMPPEADELSPERRKALLSTLSREIVATDRAEVVAHGRGPMRRLNREEYENNLRDLLQMPALDIRDILPEDRTQYGFNKSATALDMSRVQLAAYLDAADAALRLAMASGEQPPPAMNYRALATKMFPEANTFGEREAMFYARDSKMVPISGKELAEIRKNESHDPELELAIFRSASWPYYGYPHGFVAKATGEYRVKFQARAVRQVRDFRLVPAPVSQAMTFRARAPSGPDVSGDVRSTGGTLDIAPAGDVYETVVRLKAGETFEYSLLGLPVPLPITINGGPLYYDFPPMPEGGHPGVAFRWIEITGPIAPAEWPPVSHRVLFGDLPIRQSGKGSLPLEVVAPEPEQDAVRLFRDFAMRAAREPVALEALQIYEQLILTKLKAGAPFAEAMLAGYKAFLCSGHFLYLREPERGDDHYAIAARLSHFLWNSRPDPTLTAHAEKKALRTPTLLRAETDRFIDSETFEHFVANFTDYWLELKELRRDIPDLRLYPEYRLDEYLIASLGEETRAFFTAMVRENFPATALLATDFVFVNDRLARHYDLAPVEGSRMRRVPLPSGSPYGGLLTQGAIMRVTSNGTTTSPVIRGAWIMKHLVGEPPPPPPPSVPAVEPDIRGAKSIRDLLALHTKEASCATCHARFDPVGLALESFDIMGVWRDRYRGLEKGERITGIDRAGHAFAYTVAEAVDPSGKLVDGRAFKNIAELRAILAANPRQLARNLLHQFTAYATGTPVRFSDRADIERILDDCQPTDYRIRDLLRGFVASRIFLGEAGSQVANN